MQKSKGVLLPGWAENFDPESGKSYYYNEDTKLSVWERPVDPHAKRAAVKIELLETDLVDDDDGAERKVNIYDEIWPLQLLDLRDEEMMETLYTLFKYSTAIIEHYLDEFIFPMTMQFQLMKLSSNGQDLGGDMLFKRRLGFSGTPSDLLPVEMGRCHYESGSDGKMVHFLTSLKVMNKVQLEGEWTPQNILDTIALANPPYNALIDTGALITGLSNYEVAGIPNPNPPPTRTPNPNPNPSPNPLTLKLEP